MILCPKLRLKKSKAIKRRPAIIERRRDCREEALLIGESSGIPVYIVDISDSGLKISSEQHLGEPGKQIALKIQGPSNLFEAMDFKASILWVQKKDEIFLYGLHLEFQAGLEDKIQKVKELCHFVGRIRQHLLS